MAARPEITSVIVPVYNESENIYACVQRLWNVLAEFDHEILICHDFAEDTTVAALEKMPNRPRSVRLILNQFGPGPANAIRAGMTVARGDAIIVTMADLSDPPEVILPMIRKIRGEDADLVAGSRYMPGGSQIGGPPFKRFLSRVAGLSLHWIAGLGTHDATNSFKAFSRRFLDQIEIESETGFTIGLELTVKAHRGGFRIDEVPTTWVDRDAGESRFRLFKWLPAYLYWYTLGMATAISASLCCLAGLFIALCQPTLLGSPLWLRLTLSASALFLIRLAHGRYRMTDSIVALIWYAPGLVGLAAAAAFTFFSVNSNDNKKSSEAISY